MKRLRLLPVLIMIMLLAALSGCGNADVPEESEAAIPQAAEPHTKEDGTPYRIAYVDYDEYLPASRQLVCIMMGLEEQGWITPGSLPYTLEDVDKMELSTAQIYEGLQEADLGDYICFPADQFYYLGSMGEDYIAEKLKEGAGRDFDLVLTFGTSAGVLVSSLDLPVPMVDFSATDPVASGIIESANGNSGKPNVWAQVEPSVPLRQLKYYHSLCPFNKLGMIIFGDEVVSGVPDIMKASSEVGFSVIKYNIPEQSRERGPELDAYYAMLKEKFEEMAEEDIDAFFYTLDLINDPEMIPEMLEPLYEKNIPVYALDDVNSVYSGALMIICAYDIENVGRFVADAMIKIMDGEEAGSLPCIYTSAPYICVNLDVAERIDYPLSFDFLAICDEIYTEKDDEE